MATTCTVCGNTGAEFCARCNSARYCSMRCKSLDRSTHEILCENFSNFSSSPRPTSSVRPTDDYFRAILFPVDEAKPKFGWLRCESIHSLSSWKIPQVKEHLGFQAVEKVISSPYKSETSRRARSEAVRVCYRDHSPWDGSEKNKSVAAITSNTNPWNIPGRQYDWRGPIIFFTRRLDGEITDISMDDFRHAAGFLLAHNYHDSVSSSLLENPVVLIVLMTFCAPILLGFLVVIKFGATLRLIGKLGLATAHAVGVTLSDLISFVPTVILSVVFIAWDAITLVAYIVAFTIVTFGTLVSVCALGLFMMVILLLHLSRS